MKSDPKRFLEWIIPLAAAVSSYYLVGRYHDDNFLNALLSNVTNLFAILVGFTVAALAIFTTTDLKKNEVLLKLSDREIRDQKISWFRFIYANLIYSAMVGVVMLIATLLSLLLKLFIDEEVITALLVWGSLHALLLTIRNITNLYFVFFGSDGRSA